MTTEGDCPKCLGTAQFKRLHTIRGGLEVQDVLTPEECTAIMHEAEVSGYHDGTGSVRFAGNRDRAMFMQKDWAGLVWQRIKHAVLPLHYDPVVQDYESTVGFEPPAGVYVPVGVNPLLRVSRYEPGGVFRWHRDSVFASGADYVGFQTLLLYLNEDFEGGETGVDTTWYQPDLPQDIVNIVPRRGAVFTFDHSEIHQGAAVTAGRKYVVRTEVMFRHTSDSTDANSPDSTAELAASQRWTTCAGLRRRICALWSPSEARR